MVVAGSFLPFAFGAFAGMAVGLLLCTWEVGVDTVCAGCLRCCCIGLVGTVVLLAAGFGAVVAVVAGSLGCTALPVLAVLLVKNGCFGGGWGLWVARCMVSGWSWGLCGVRVSVWLGGSFVLC